MGERRRETEKERRGSETDVPKLYTYNEYEHSVNHELYRRIWTASTACAAALSRRSRPSRCRSSRSPRGSPRLNPAPRASLTLTGKKLFLYITHFTHICDLNEITKRLSCSWRGSQRLNPASKDINR